jgi:N utilization substance protein B
MASRRKGRILAFQALYSWEANKKYRDRLLPLEDLLQFSWVDKELDPELIEFSRIMVAGTIENLDAVDVMIRRQLQNWEFSRLNQVDLALLRLSAYTLMYQREMAPSIVIDEAVNIAREYSADNSFRFVNGVLDSIRAGLENQGENPEK